ncbi:hypothetical protein C7382_106133 [Porphyromonas loveana]|uniref:Uncharacterized protein n=1 Tax=Porphyromonas loveana TaxID=1884669 RepID=A0A2U1FHM8_9PORP|nr:hypothetical protein C7382_106133 [Porphyromonas loveana]
MKVPVWPLYCFGQELKDGERQWTGAMGCFAKQ